jgi:predicted RNA binding protein YcfA (HicA-like mRNA interferase family)
MSRMPTITAKVMIGFLESLGFAQVRQKSSHKFLGTLMEERRRFLIIRGKIWGVE